MFIIVWLLLLMLFIFWDLEIQSLICFDSICFAMSRLYLAQQIIFPVKVQNQSVQKSIRRQRKKQSQSGQNVWLLLTIDVFTINKTGFQIQQPDCQNCL